MLGGQDRAVLCRQDRIEQCSVDMTGKNSVGERGQDRTEQYCADRTGQSSVGWT